MLEQIPCQVMPYWTVQMDLDEFVLQIGTEENNVTNLLTTPLQPSAPEDSLYQEQRKYPKLAVIIDYLENEVLPKEEKEARKTAMIATKFVILDKVLYFIDQKKTGRRCTAVPQHLQGQLLQEYHGGRMAGHFSGKRDIRMRGETLIRIRIV